MFRWASELEEYDYEIVYRPGKLQTHLDALPRLPHNLVSLHTHDNKDMVITVNQVHFTEGGLIRLT